MHEHQQPHTAENRNTFIKMDGRGDNKRFKREIEEWRKTKTETRKRETKHDRSDLIRFQRGERCGYSFHLFSAAPRAFLCFCGDLNESLRGATVNPVQMCVLLRSSL